MTAELKCKCIHCDGPMEFPVEMQGQIISCPHCGSPTTLRASIVKPYVPAIPVQRTAYIKSKSETFGGGMLVQVIGLCVVWIFPIGTVVGILLLIAGGKMARKQVCSECGNMIHSKDVKICPVCRATF